MCIPFIQNNVLLHIDNGISKQVCNVLPILCHNGYLVYIIWQLGRVSIVPIAPYNYLIVEQGLAFWNV